MDEVGQSLPRFAHLLKDRHDLIDHAEESAAGILSPFDQITTLLGVLIQGDQLTGVIFVDQCRSVT